MDDIRTRKLLMMASALSKNIDDLWNTYRELFNEVDLDDPHVYPVVFDLVAELEYNLVDVLDQVAGQIYVLTGVHEPLPTEPVEDFEASILSDLAKLDSVDLEVYRVSDFYDEEEEEEDYDEQYG